MNYWQYMASAYLEADRIKRQAQKDEEALLGKIRPKARMWDGSMVDPYDPQPWDMKPMVFIHSISCLNRFTGHAAYPYSVGQHTRNLVLVVPDRLKRAALVHDFAEAWFNDMCSPVKRQNPAYKEAEHEAGIRICNAFGVTSDEIAEFDDWDKRIYVNERDVLFSGKVNERGIGDELTALDLKHLPHVFKETNWRRVRGDLTLLWLTLFPEYDLHTGEYIDGYDS